METVNPAGEWSRLNERYGQMSDLELLSLARRLSELTDIAQQALQSEMTRRGLQSPGPEPPPPEPETPPDSPYVEDRQLVELCKVWSPDDGLRLQEVLDRAGIPFFMGEEKATGVDLVTSSFAAGVIVQVMQIGLPWARAAMANYFPVDAPASEQQEEPAEVVVRCPQCDSTEVVLRHVTSAPAEAAADSSPVYRWSCDSCGHRWSDDGVVD